MYPKKGSLKGNLFINLDFDVCEDVINQKVEDDILKPEEAGFLRGNTKGNEYRYEE